MVNHHKVSPWFSSEEQMKGLGLGCDVFRGQHYLYRHTLSALLFLPDLIAQSDKHTYMEYISGLFGFCMVNLILMFMYFIFSSSFSFFLNTRLLLPLPLFPTHFFLLYYFLTSLIQEAIQWLSPDCMNLFWLSSLKSIIEEQNLPKNKCKTGCKSLCMQRQMEDQCLNAHAIPMGPSLKCSCPTMSVSISKSRKLTERSGLRERDALTSHSNRRREWQAGVSSLTWVQQHRGKALHLATEPWREVGKEEED